MSIEQDIASLSKAAFTKGFGVANGAGECAIQLHNPAGSNRILLLRKLYVSTSVAGSVAVYGGPDSALTGGTIADFGYGVNAYQGQTAGKGRFWSKVDTTVAGLIDRHAEIVLAADDPFPIKFDNPLVVPEGQSIVVFSAVVSTVLGAIWQYEEKVSG